MRDAAPPVPPGARAWVELDLDAVRANVRTILGTAGVPLVAVVKANGYGHGRTWVARAAISAGASSIAVATAAEAAELRRDGVAAPIHILGSFLSDELEIASRASASLTIHEPGDIRRLRAHARSLGRAVPVQLKVDVGMHRHGVALNQVLPILSALTRDKALRLEGLFTHLPSATEEDLTRTRSQVATFASVVECANAAGLLPPRVHAAASAALFRIPEARFQQVRAGIAVVGLDPHGRIASSGVTLRPALTLRARVTRTRAVRAGESVGYGGRWVAPRDSRLAIVGLGYADGLPYSLTGRPASVLLQGQRCPIVGSVMMDYALVDVTDLPRTAQPEDVVTVFGRDGDGFIPLEEQAAQAGLIPYALACGLGNRLERVVHGLQAAPRRRLAA